MLPSFPPELTPNSHDVCKTYTHPCLFIPCVPGILCIFPPFVLAHTLVWLCDLLLFHSHIVTIWDAADTWATHEISSDIARINFTKARMRFIFSKFQFGGGIKNSLHQDAVKSIKRFFLIDKDLLFDNFFPFLSPAINKQNKTKTLSLFYQESLKNLERYYKCLKIFQTKHIHLSLWHDL